MKKFSKQIPIFPLSGALLLPSGNLPLNIFEPRYISMIDYAFKNNKIIGMIQPKSKNSKELFKIGCIGKITTYSQTNDDRYIINLKGLSKFKIINEIQHSAKFRIFNVKYEGVGFDFDKFDNNLFQKERFLKKIKSFLTAIGVDADLQSLKKVNDKSLIIMVAMICPFSVGEKQALLECKNINILADTINSLLDFEINQSNNYETIN